MFNRRLIIFFLILSIFFVVIFARLIALQVYAHQDYLDDAQQLLLRPPVLLPSVRGQIFDRNGKLLAANEPCFNIGIHYGAISLDEKYVDTLARARARANGIKLKRRDPTPPEYLQQVKSQIDKMWDDLPSLIPLPAELTEKANLIEDPERIKELIEELINDRRQQTIRRIERMRSTSVSIYETRLQKAQDNWLESAQSQSIRRQIDSLVLREELSFIPVAFYLPNDTARRIQNDLGCPEWLTLIPTTRRIYPRGYVAAQLIGSIGQVNKDDLEALAKGPAEAHLNDPRRRYAPEGDIIGRSGVERGYDWSVLRGSRGLQQKDRLGNLVPGSNLPPEKGRDLHLTIDIDLQADLEKAMAKPSPDSPDSPAAPAAAVVIDIATGQVLALASTPLLGRADSKPPFHVKGDYPWMNRCVEAIYPPGSIVKPAVILAGLSPRLRSADTEPEPPVITPRTVYHCPTDQDGFAQPSCGNHPHGSVDPYDAIKRSCNVCCATVAELLSWDLVAWFVNIGLTRPTNLHLPREHPGMIPGGIQSHGGPLRRLLAAELRQMAIGQGKIAVTPLQVANMMATIARRGVYVPPSLTVDQAQDAGSIDLEVNPEHIKLVIDAMEAVVHESGGTAYRISELHDTDLGGLRIAGKTGTAEYNRNITDDWRCWFAGFAPVDKPQIAFAVVIEHGDSGAKVAGPRAAELLQLCIDHGYIKTVSSADLSLRSASPP